MKTEARFAAVVLAAGAGSRFGGGKLLALYRGAPLLHAALAAARAAPVAGITVVTGADAEAVTAAARAFDPGLTLVHAADHAEGMAACTSVRSGSNARAAAATASASAPVTTVIPATGAARAAARAACSSGAPRYGAMSLPPPNRAPAPAARTRLANLRTVPTSGSPLSCVSHDAL